MLAVRFLSLFTRYYFRGNSLDTMIILIRIHLTVFLKCDYTLEKTEELYLLNMFDRHMNYEYIF